MDLCGKKENEREDHSKSEGRPERCGCDRSEQNDSLYEWKPEVVQEAHKSNMENGRKLMIEWNCGEL